MKSKTDRSKAGLVSQRFGFFEPDSSDSPERRYRFFSDHRAITILLLSLVTAMWVPSAYASKAAWVFAHRANTLESVEAAHRDQGVNAVEIDVTFRTDLNKKKRRGCGEQWCAFHSMDRKAVNLSTILQEVRRSKSLHAVWFDVKSVDAPKSAYRSLQSMVRKELGARKGKPALRKFWGAYLSAVQSNYVTITVSSVAQPAARSDNTFIFDINNARQPGKVNNFCRSKKIQCGLSAGIFNSGGVLASDGGNIDLLSHRIALSHINSLFLWTLNWSGHNEDDMLRLLFRQRDYWERMSGFGSYCGLEGNGVIVGPATKIYSAAFCRTADKGDACSVAHREIVNGPNSFGNLNSDIGRKRNGYSTGEC